MRPRILAGFTLAAALFLGACADADPTGPDVPATPGTVSTLASASDAPAPGSGFVYTSTNQAGGNDILRFARGSDGALAPAGSWTTGGLGTGGGLGNQGALTLSTEGTWLLVVNAGSDEVSVFRTRPTLALTDRESSGGTRPISVAVHRDLVYVLNGGGDENVAGFRLDRSGDLHPIPGARYPLSEDQVGSAQLGFSPDGGTLVVTEKATNRIVSFPVDADGRLGPAEVDLAAGQTPFGFAFSRTGTLVVSEAFGGAPSASTLSSYRIAGAAGLDVISPQVATTQTAACWVVISPDGRHAWTTNAGTGSISLYRLDARGELTLADAQATLAPGTTPLDMGLSRGGRFLYVLNAGTGSIAGYRVDARGGLTVVEGGTTTGLPAGANGLAVD
jgi:6-phosphogluconolactonase